MKHLTILTGASRGMGLAMARQLLTPDATLVCISRQHNAVLEREARQTGATLEQWTLDLAEGAQAAARLGNWLDAQDPPAIASVTLINNAGVISSLVPLHDAAPGDLAYALRVGLEAPLQLCAAFLAATRGWPMPRKVLNISSGLGRRAMASSSAYCAAKAGLDHFTRCMALDEARLVNGAKVCSLAPGVVDTDMQIQLRGADIAAFPDQGAFAGLHSQGELTSPAQAAKRILRYLAQPGFGCIPVADIREVAT